MPGDKVQIAIFNEDNLSGSYVVAPDGQVTLPLAGGIEAAGLILAEFQQAVVEKIEGRDRPGAQRHGQRGGDCGLITYWAKSRSRENTATCPT